MNTTNSRLTPGIFTSFALGLLLALGGCGDDGGTTTDGGTGTDTTTGGDTTGTDTGTGGDVATGTCDTGETYFYVLDVILPGTASAANPSEVPGFNLDGRDSDADDAEGCGKTDFTYQGTAGIDNQFGPMVADLVGFGFDVEASIADAIQMGTLTILVKVEHVDDFTNDDCATTSLYIGDLPDGVDPVLSGGRYEPNQTFDILATFGNPVISFEAPIVGGNITGSSVDPVPLTLPVGPDVDPVMLEMERPNASFTIAEGQITEGILGGSFDRMAAITALEALAPGMEGLVAGLVNGQVDLDPDSEGACQSLSLAFTYEGIISMEGMTR